MRKTSYRSADQIVLFPIRAGWSFVMPYSARSPRTFPLLSNRANIFRVWSSFLFLFLDVYMPAAAHAQDGATLFKTYCATCHEAGDSRAPNREIPVATQSGADPSGA